MNPNSKMAQVGCVEDAMQLLALGRGRRRVGAHALNAVSSRSHALLTLTVETRAPAGGGDGAAGGSSHGGNGPGGSSGPTTPHDALNASFSSATSSASVLGAVRARARAARPPLLPISPLPEVNNRKCTEQVRASAGGPEREKRFSRPAFFPLLPSPSREKSLIGK